MRDVKHENLVFMSDSVQNIGMHIYYTEMWRKT